METGLVADLGIVKAWKADPYGNLIFRKSARNLNPMAAACGRITVAEVENIVGRGMLEPDSIHTPGIFVKRVILATRNEKRIEQRTVRQDAA